MKALNGNTQKNIEIAQESFLRSILINFQKQSKLIGSLVKTAFNYVLESYKAEIDSVMSFLNQLIRATGGFFIAFFFYCISLQQLFLHTDIVHFSEFLVDVRPYGFGNEGVWKPIGVNECVRFSKYVPGKIGFKPHK